MGNSVVARVHLSVGVGVGMGALDTAKHSANFLMTSVVWEPKRAKGAASAGIARALARRLAVSVDASTEDIVGKAPLWGKTLIFLLWNLPMSPERRSFRIGSGVGMCQCITLTCHGNPMFASAVVFCG